MKVLSLFDGMSCGQIALSKLGIKVDKYYASEIDKYAIEITQKNFPDTIQLGDVCQLDPKDFMDVDLIQAGSPCQGFSFAGAQLAFDDPRSALFFEFIRLLKEIGPKYFLLENVRMKKEFLEVITDQVSSCYTADDVDDEYVDMFGNVRFEPHFINSSLLSAQSRQRYYWTNIPNIKQPKDKGIVLRDILETETDERPVKDTERNQRHYKNEDEKSLCMTATMYKGAGNNGMTLVPTKPKQVGIAVDVNGHDILKRVYSPDGKSPTVTTCGGGNTEPKVVVGGAIRGRSKNKDGKHVAWKETKPQQMLELRKDEKSNSISTVSKDSLVVQSYREVRTDEAKKARKETRQKTGKDHTPFRAKKLEPRKDGKVGTITPSLNKDHEISIEQKDEKSNSISTVSKDSLAVFSKKRVDKFKETMRQDPLTKYIQEKDVKSEGIVQLNDPSHSSGRVYSPKGKSPTLMAGESGGGKEPCKINDDLVWRKLTPLECERLQTVPDNYTEGVSNTQRYRMLGNGWTCDVIAHIYKNMEVDET